MEVVILRLKGEERREACSVRKRNYCNGVMTTAENMQLSKHVKLCDVCDCCFSCSILLCSGEMWPGGDGVAPECPSAITHSVCCLTSVPCFCEHRLSSPAPQQQHPGSPVREHSTISALVLQDFLEGRGRKSFVH